MHTTWNTLRRWRTWIFNLLAALLILAPELVTALTAYHWGDIIPAKYMPIVSLVIVIVNVLMRPRPAVLPGDIEAQR